MCVGVRSAPARVPASPPAALPPLQALTRGLAHPRTHATAHGHRIRLTRWLAWRLTLKRRPRARTAVHTHSSTMSSATHVMMSMPVDDVLRPGGERQAADICPAARPRLRPPWLVKVGAAAEAVAASSARLPACLACPQVDPRRYAVSACRPPSAASCPSSTHTLPLNRQFQVQLAHAGLPRLLRSPPGGVRLLPLCLAALLPVPNPLLASLPDLDPCFLRKRLPRTASSGQRARAKHPVPPPSLPPCCSKGSWPRPNA